MKKTVSKCICVFLLSFLLKGLVFFQNTDIMIISDWIGDLALPTYLAGLDWHNLVSATSYYGYGFKWAYTIFFMWTDNPYVIYLSIELLHTFLQCVLASVSYYYFVKKCNAKQDAVTIIWICIITASAYTSMASEAHIYMAFWILCLLLMTLVHTEKTGKRRWYSLLISVWACYMITLHERCMAVVIALIFVLVLWRIYEKKWIVDLKIFIPSLILSYCIQEKITQKIIDLFWSVKQSEGTLVNTSVLSNNMLWFTESLDNLVIFLECLCTNLYTLFIRTYGMGIFAIVFVVMFIINTICKRKKEISELFDANKELSVMLLLSAVSVTIIIVGVAVRWGIMVANDSAYGYKGYSYTRYWIAFAWPGALAIILLWRQAEKYPIQKVKYVVGGLTLFVTTVFFLWLYPLLQSLRESEIYNVFSCMTFFEGIKPMEGRIRFLLLSIGIMLAGVSLVLLRTKKCMYVYTILVLILMVAVKTSGFNVSKPSIECSYFDATYDCIKTMENTAEIPHELYYYGNKPHSCQFMLNRYSIINEWPDVNTECAIVFSRKNVETLKSELETVEDYCYVNFEDEEYIYIKGAQYRDIFAENGYQVLQVE